MLNKPKIAHTTRRGFLGAAALTAAQYKRVLGANDRIGVGFIGFGLIGKQHVADFKKFKDVDLVGLCDVLQAARGRRPGVHRKSQRQRLRRFPEDVREQGHPGSRRRHAGPLALPCTPSWLAPRARMSTSRSR